MPQPTGSTVQGQGRSEGLPVEADPDSEIDLENYITRRVWGDASRGGGSGPEDGQRITVTGLVSRADLNGRQGVVLGSVKDSGRFEVRVDSGCRGPKARFRVKPCNLRASGRLASGKPVDMSQMAMLTRGTSPFCDPGLPLTTVQRESGQRHCPVCVVTYKPQYASRAAARAATLIHNDEPKRFLEQFKTGVCSDECWDRAFLEPDP